MDITNEPTPDIRVARRRSPVSRMDGCEWRGPLRAKSQTASLLLSLLVVDPLVRVALARLERWHFMVVARFATTFTTYSTAVITAIIVIIIIIIIIDNNMKPKHPK